MGIRAVCDGFQAADRVRVTDRASPFFRRSGFITKITEMPEGFRFYVDFGSKNKQPVVAAFTVMQIVQAPLKSAVKSKPKRTKAKPNPRTHAVPGILPREPLTKKARAAIERYALIKCGEATFLQFLIDHSLHAERMRRANLYEWLEARGWRWKAQWRTWRKQE